MLQNIRQNIQGTIAKIIIGLIVVSFAIFGIESLLFSAGGNAVAEVNGEEISPFALQQEVTLQQRQLFAMLGENADPALLDETRLRDGALEALIESEVLAQATRELGLAASDEALGQMIAGMEQFQLDGSFSPELYRSSLAQAGFTPQMFRARLAREVVRSQFRSGVAGSEFVTPLELANAARVVDERRDLRYLTLSLDRYHEASEPQDDDISAYYTENAQDFTTPERLVLDYVELGIDDYREPIDEARLREEFELTRDQYQLAQESRVSHILIEGDDDERSRRIAEVQAALDSGLTFAEAAETFSDDIGSASAGGDLGYTAGSTFPEPMEAAIADLAVGDISGPVETDAGTHLIRVTDRRDGTTVRFEDVRSEIEERLQTADAAAALLRDIERLRDLAFNAIDLSEPAAGLSIDAEIERSQPISRDQTSGLFADSRLLDAAFSEDVLEAGHNSPVIELDPEHFVVLRLAERLAPEQQPLDSVRPRIVTILRERQAEQAARADAEALLARLEAGEGIEALANEGGHEWQVELGARRDSTRLPAPVRTRLFSLPAPGGGASQHALVEGTEAIYLLELTRVTQGSIETLADERRAPLERRLAGEAGGLLQRQYEAGLRASADVTVF